MKSTNKTILYPLHQFLAYSSLFTLDKFLYYQFWILCSDQLLAAGSSSLIWYQRRYVLFLDFHPENQTKKRNNSFSIKIIFTICRHVPPSLWDFLLKLEKLLPSRRPDYWDPLRRDKSSWRTCCYIFHILGIKKLLNVGVTSN